MGHLDPVDTSQLGTAFPLEEDYQASDLDSLLALQNFRQPLTGDMHHAGGKLQFSDNDLHDLLLGDSSQRALNMLSQYTLQTTVTPGNLVDGREDTVVLFSCYPFIQADTLGRLSSNDISFLEQRGCFHLPARSALEEFVREYFSHVHPILPVLNEASFWRVTSSRYPLCREQHGMSLFLLQAILFISCPVSHSNRESIS